MARSSVTRTLETAAMVTITAIVIQWIVLAWATAEVSGSDAALVEVATVGDVLLLVHR